MREKSVGRAAEAASESSRLAPSTPRKNPDRTPSISRTSPTEHASGPTLFNDVESTRRNGYLTPVASGDEARGLTPRSMRQWQHECSSFAQKTLRDNAVVHRQGESCAFVYYVVSGYIKLAATDRSGRGIVRAILHAGDFFGAISGQTHQPTDHAALCKGAVQMYRCDAAQFGRLLETQPDIMRYVLANLGTRLTFAHRQTEAALHQSATSRLVLMLFQLVGRHGGQCRHGHAIDIRLTQQEMADLIGASRPVVSTILNDLRQRRILDYTRSFICIESMAALEKMLD